MSVLCDLRVWGVMFANCLDRNELAMVPKANRAVLTPPPVGKGLLLRRSKTLSVGDRHCLQVRELSYWASAMKHEPGQVGLVPFEPTRCTAVVWSVSTLAVDFP